MAVFEPFGPYMLVTCPGDSEALRYCFECPGCGYSHTFTCGGGRGPRWTFNGSADSPTFAPSLMVNRSDPRTRCHLFVRDGQIQFLHDCHHPLAGRTVPLTPINGDAA